MAYMRCSGGSGAEKPLIFSYYKTRNITDECEINDTYVVVVANGVTPTVTNLELLDSFVCGSATYQKAYIYRATSNSISINCGSYTNVSARFSKNGKNIQYDLINIASAGTTVNIQAEINDFILCPYVSTGTPFNTPNNLNNVSHPSSAVGSNITCNMLIYRVMNTSASIYSAQAYKILRLY